MGTKKRRVAKRPRTGTSRNTAGATRSNRRRHARPDRTANHAGMSEGPSTQQQSQPPRGGRAVLRACARWGLRLAVAGGLAYAALWGLQESYEYATTSPRFEVRGLLFEPTPHVSDARLRELMGIEPGTNILALDLDGLAASVAREPWVSKASVTRVLPDSLSVSIEEHAPAAVLLAGGFYLLSGDGHPFKPLAVGERGELPVITGLHQGEMIANTRDAHIRVERALAALAAYQEKLRPRLSEIHVDDTGSITMYTADLGSQLRLGRGDLRAALGRFDALRAALGEESDKLAVAHLDATAEQASSDRVIASFFPTKQAPSFVADASRRASERADRHAELVATAEEHKKRARGATQGKKRSRLPRYE